MPIALLEAGTGGCRLALCGTCAAVCREVALAVLGAVGVRLRDKNSHGLASFSNVQ